MLALTVLPVVITARMRFVVVDVLCFALSSPLTTVRTSRNNVRIISVLVDALCVLLFTDPHGF